MTISAVVTTHNRAPLLRATIDAMLAQTHPAHEIIVVNDGSTDDTAEVLAEYGSKIVAINQLNTGVQTARNAGFLRATGRYVALSDDDDLWLPRYLEAQAALLAAEPDIEVSFGNFQSFSGDVLESQTKFDQAPAGWWEELPRRIVPQGWIFTASIAGATFVFHPIFPSATIVSKALWRKVGGYHAALGHVGGEDGEFVLRCLYNGKTAALPEPLVRIRRHEGNVSRDLVKRLMEEVQVLAHIRDTHSEAAAYGDVIAREMRSRRIQAFNAAFESFDHAAVRNLFSAIAMEDRSAKLWAKRVVAAVPAPLARPLNGLLQSLAGGGVGSDGSTVR